MPDLPINREAALRKIINKLSVTADITAARLIAGDSSTEGDWSEAFKHAESEILQLIDSYAASLVEEGKIAEATRQLTVLKSFVGQYRKGDEPDPEKLLQKQNKRIHDLNKRKRNRASTLLGRLSEEDKA